MKKYFIGTLLIAGILAFFSVAGAESSQTKTTKFGIEGMSCGGCAPAAKIALEKLDGVTDAKVSYKNKEAIVEYLEGEVTLEEMAEAVNGLGFKASVKPYKGEEK